MNPKRHTPMTIMPFLVVGFRVHGYYLLIRKPLAFIMEIGEITEH